MWEMQKGKHISTLALPYKVSATKLRHHRSHTHANYHQQQCSSLVCPSSSSMAVVGTEKGSICVVSLVDPLQPKMVLVRRMHPSAITALRFVHSAVLFFFVVSCTCVLICPVCLPDVTSTGGLWRPCPTVALCWYTRPAHRPNVPSWDIQVSPPPPPPPPPPPQGKI